MKITGMQIKRFFECTTERIMRKSNSMFKGTRWGKFCENLYLNTIKNQKEDIFKITQFNINKAFPSLDISTSSNLIKNLTNIIKKMRSDKKQEILKTNMKLQNNQYSIELDMIIRDSSGAGFIREFKSYPSPGYYVWNSDLMQLAVQNMVLSSYYNIHFYYGEIAYLGDGKIIEINTSSYEKLVYFARRQILNDHKKISCEKCKFYDLPCYTQVRYFKVSNIGKNLIV